MKKLKQSFGQSRDVPGDWINDWIIFITVTTKNNNNNNKFFYSACLQQQI